VLRDWMILFAAHAQPGRQSTSCLLHNGLWHRVCGACRHCFVHNDMGADWVHICHPARVATDVQDTKWAAHVLSTPSGTVSENCCFDQALTV
jgi:hypothetical protein